MNSLIISIGSNDDPDGNLKKCRDYLTSLFDNIVFSETSTTKPYGSTAYQHDFVNQLAWVETEMSAHEVLPRLKSIEKRLGRTVEDKMDGLVKIDVDLVKCNDEVIKEEDWERSYVSELLPSLMESVPVK